METVLPPATQIQWDLEAFALSVRELSLACLEVIEDIGLFILMWESGGET